MHELNIHKIRPEKTDQAIGPELQVTLFNRNFFIFWRVSIITTI